MQAIARVCLFVQGMLSLVVSLRSLVDSASVEAWRREDAIWGTNALPFNAAGGLAVGFACLYGVLSPEAFSPGVRGRMVAFFALGALVELSLGRTKGVLDLFLILSFWAACREVDEMRRMGTPEAEASGALAG